MANRKTKKEGKFAQLKRRVQKILDQELARRMDGPVNGFDLAGGDVPMPSFPAMRPMGPPLQPALRHEFMDAGMGPEIDGPAYGPEPMDPAFRPP